MRMLAVAPLKGAEVTSITEQPAQTTEMPQREQDRSGLVYAVWVLAILVVGLSAWVITDLVVDSRTATTAAIDALIADYNAAWNDYDGAAFEALVADGYVFVDGVQTTNVDEQVGIIENVMKGWQFAVEETGEPMMYGDGPWYVAQLNHVTTITNQDGSGGFSVFTIVERDGTLLVQRHEWLGY